MVSNLIIRWWTAKFVNIRIDFIRWFQNFEDSQTMNIEKVFKRNKPHELFQKASHAKRIKEILIITFLQCFSSTSARIFQSVIKFSIDRIVFFFRNLGVENVSKSLVIRGCILFAIPAVS